MKEIKLTISVLLSDRTDTIKRCLDSLIPLRESVNSELILTVTTEDSRVRRIAGEYGDRVISFTWCNDFSRARNAGLEAASGEWFLYLDDDEWFADCGELIRFFTGEEHEKYAYGDYIQRNYQDRGLHYYADTPVSRMVNLRYGIKGGAERKIRFRSRIHEYFSPVKGPGKLLGETIALHTGYIQEDEKTGQRRFRRNAPLIMQMMEEEPDNLRWPVQLVQEYRQVQLWAWEAGLGKKYLYGESSFGREDKKLLPALDADDFGAFCGAAVEGLAEGGRETEALAVIRACLADSRCVDMTRAFLYLEKALILLRSGIGAWTSADSRSVGRGKDCAAEDPVMCAEQLVEQYFRVCEDLDQNPQKKARESGMVIVGEAVERISRIRAESIRLCCHLLMGDHCYFEKVLSVLEWDQPAVYLLDELITVWAEVMAETRESGSEQCRMDKETRDEGRSGDGLWEKPLELAWRNQRIREKLLTEFQKRETPALFRQLTGLGGDHWYLCYARVCVQQKTGDRAEQKKLLEQYFCCCENIFRIPEKIGAVMDKEGLVWEKLVSGVDFVKLSRDMADYYDGQIDQGAVGSAEEYWFDPDRVLELWIKKGTDHINMLYNPAIVMENPSCLPQECRAVLCFAQADSRVQGLKAAIQEWPDLVPFARAYVSELQSSEPVCSGRPAGTAETDGRGSGPKEDGQAAGVLSEMDQLAAQILAQVRPLMAQGDRDQAAVILSQLKTMVPENEELLRMEEELAREA